MSIQLRIVNAPRPWPGISAALSNLRRMKTVDEIRRTNLELLVQEYATLEGLAAVADTSASYLSQVRNAVKNSAIGAPRGIGTTLARRLEWIPLRSSCWRPAVPVPWVAHGSPGVPPTNVPQAGAGPG